MKVLYYQRVVHSSIHIHAGIYTEILYIPDEEAILYRERQGTFGGFGYSLTERPELLREAKAVAGGQTPEGIEVASSKMLDCESGLIRELINAARQKSELEERVRIGIERLIEQAQD